VNNKPYPLYLKNHRLRGGFAFLQQGLLVSQAWPELQEFQELPV
jgi:hypothetical protein